MSVQEEDPLEAFAPTVHLSRPMKTTPLTLERVLFLSKIDGVNALLRIGSMLKLFNPWVLRR